MLLLITRQCICDCSLVKSRVSFRFVAKSYSMHNVHIRSSKRWPFGKSSPHGLFVHCQGRCIDDVYLSQYMWVPIHHLIQVSLLKKGSIPISCTCRPILQSRHTLANRSGLHGLHRLHMHGQLSGQMHRWCISFPIYVSSFPFIISFKSACWKRFHPNFMHL